MEHNLLITVSGPPGSGASSTSQALAEALGVQRVDGGEVFRELAEERGMSLTQFSAKADEDPEIDQLIDRRLQRVAEVWGASNKGFVLESRLAGWLAGNRADLRIWLNAPEEVRVERTADREEMESEMRVREVQEVGRFERAYGVDVTDTSFYDLSVNTSRWSRESVVEIIMQAVSEYEYTEDEGAFTNEIELPETDGETDLGPNA
ncbi:(d)CMP kinase [Haloglomus halophilum]|uniref:(d)CMP kinase n=1 Tax=Haloglomus halophilum TaxID=2962672 RepID=UPI0020C9A095|nr:AAA family ATPase [Haloglomus halophilum]